MTHRSHRRSGLLFAVVALILSGVVHAHQMRTGYLDITEQSTQRLAIAWRSTVPVPPPAMMLGADCVQEGGGRTGVVQSVYCAGGVAGQAVTLQALGATVSEVLVRINFRDGRQHTQLLSPNASSFQIPLAPQSGWQALLTYCKLGVQHLLLGGDHLLFLLALFLLVRRPLHLLAAATAFTVAHSITLALVVLDQISLDAHATEACIALSLILIAYQVVTVSADKAVSNVKTWLALAFFFGLLHGLGFAGVLRDIGLPEQSVAMALVGFNIGLEIGQIGLLLLCLTLIGGIEAMISLPRLRLAGGYVVGVMGAFWLLLRI